jgi:hypothetical protein
MIDHLYRDPAGGGFGEWAGGVAVEAAPGFFVDFGLQSRFQRLVGIIGAEDVNRRAKLTPDRRPKLTPLVSARSGPEPTELVRLWRRVRP